MSEGWARWNNPERKEATLGVKFSIFQPVYANYDVIATDYTSFAIVYSGSPPGCLFRGYELVWVLSRKPLTKGSTEHLDLYEKVRKICEEGIPNF